MPIPCNGGASWNHQGKGLTLSAELHSTAQHSPSVVLTGRQDRPIYQHTLLMDTHDGGLSGRSLMNQVLFSRVLLLLLLAALAPPASLVAPSLLLRDPLSVVSSAGRRGINACTCTSTPSCAPCCQDCCRHVCKDRRQRARSKKSCHSGSGNPH